MPQSNDGEKRLNIVLVKFGDKYNSDHVNTLAGQLCDLGKVWCYTDDYIDIGVECIEPPLEFPRLKGVWNKLALFSKDFPVLGPILYLDLDTIVQWLPDEPIIPTDKLALIYNYKKEGIITPTNYDVIINSSIMCFDNRHSHIQDIWKHFTESGLMDYFMRKYEGIDRYLHHEQFETIPLNHLSTSWKYDDIHDRPFITAEECDFKLVQERTQAYRGDLFGIKVWGKRPIPNS